MEDSRIVGLYWARDENAIRETAAKYGRYCFAIAMNILARQEDAEESVNDTWMQAWNSMPPHRPAILSTFLGKLTRRVSLKRQRARNAEKRGGGQVPLALEELMECIPAGPSVEETLSQQELARSIDGFLAGLPRTEQAVFLFRYWRLASIAQVAESFGFSESKVKSMLFRTRKKLLAHLQKEGVFR